MKTLTLNKQISVSKTVSIVALNLNVEKYDDDYVVNAVAVLNSDVDWMQLPNQLMRNIETVTKSLLADSFASLKDVKVNFSEQGRQFRNAMDMDVFFETTDSDGFPLYDDQRTNQVFANL